MAGEQLALRYGTNPHQAPARLFSERGPLPVTVLNGAPGYINLLDALNGWQLVRELRAATGLAAAASFKHVSPAGAAIAVPLDDSTRRAYFVDELELSPLATAYARARGADRVSSFGDFAAFSEPVDLATARLLRREVSDGVIAPGYEPAALELLRRKRDGRYLILAIDPAYEPAALERREVFGLALEQPRNHLMPGSAWLERRVTARRELPDEARRDLLVALVALKYTQSNSVCLALDGQVIGMGAGQQSRIHCTRLAAAKAESWWLRRHPATLDLRLRRELGRPERDNAIDGFVRDDLTPAERRAWAEAFDAPPPLLTPDERLDWLAGLRGVSLASDAYIPFRDNIDRAHGSGVAFVAQPGGSARDAEVIAACDAYGMTMAFTGVRLFHH
jgi:phosphoribosylaminoimidazolecarboxamide formyltransferase/IMP cyclohydrolase